MRPRTFVRRLQAWLFVLPLFALPLLALGCSGSEHSPTEPIAQPKAAADAVVATAQGQSAPAERGDGEELRPGAARLRAAQGARPVDQAAKPETPNVANAARGGNGKPPGGNGGGNGGGNNGGNNGGGSGNGGGGRGGALTFEIRPDVWNTNWIHAA